MIRRTCTACKQVVDHKPAWNVFTWWDADNNRVSYKGSWCVMCQEILLDGLIEAEEQVTMTCPMCGIDTSGDYVLIYGNYVKPPREQGRLEMPCCDPCATKLKAQVADGGTLTVTPSPSLVGEAPSPLESVKGVYRSLGRIDPGRR